jgi:nucleoside-triphosphatase THEP1
MNIILEGPNGAGKSTLAEILHNKLGHEVVHAGGPSEDFSQFRRRSYAELNKMSDKKQSFVFDRVQPISFVVYQTWLSREKKAAYEIINYMLEEDTVLIYCNGVGKPDFDNKSHYNQDLIDDVTKRQAVIRSMYDRVMGDFPHLTYNFVADGNLKKLLQELKT